MGEINSKDRLRCPYCDYPMPYDITYEDFAITVQNCGRHLRETRKKLGLTPKSCW